MLTGERLKGLRTEKMNKLNKSNKSEHKLRQIKSGKCVFTK